MLKIYNYIVISYIRNYIIYNYIIHVDSISKVVKIKKILWHVKPSDLETILNYNIFSKISIQYD